MIWFPRAPVFTKVQPGAGKFGLLRLSRGVLAAQLRNALVLATALKRTLVLPRMIAGLDRWWAPHDGMIPGSHGMYPPLFMPADHILDLHECVLASLNT